MDISNMIRQNRIEIENMKAAQANSLSSLNKNIYPRNYTVSALGSTGTYLRLIYVFFGNQQGYTPMGVLNVRVVSDSRSNTSGKNKMLWVRQIENQSAGQIGWEVMIGWFLTDGSMNLELQVISNMAGEIDVVDGGRKQSWL